MQEYKDCRNPVLPPEIHIPDSEAHVMPDGRVYVYGSWDQGDYFFCSKEYRVVSSANMVDWTDHGVSFESGRVPWINDENTLRYPGGPESMKPTPFMLKSLPSRPRRNDVAEKKPPVMPQFHRDLLFAPDVIHRNGKYYLYFCTSAGLEGVAVSDKPEGPFDNAVQLPCGGIDPAVFVDDDGQAYYYWGQFYAKGAKLKDNMMELVEGSIVENLITEEQHFFHEGSSMRKRGDTYYLVYACMERGKPTSLGYATSKSPLGPFEYKGIIVDNDGCDPQSWNNHGSIEEINGHWYVFYHRSSRNSRKNRRMCIEPITFNEDGTINEVKMTSQGAGRAFGLGEPIHAFRACGLTGNCHIAPDGNLVEGLVGIKDGDTAVFRYVDWAADALEVAVKAFGSGVIGVYLDGSESAAGQIVLKDGEVVSSEVKSAKGKHEILIKFSDVQDLTLHAITFK